MNWTTSDIPDQTGRVALITGANSGIGFDAARALAAKGAHVVMGCRSMNKAQAAKGRLDAMLLSGKVTILEMDLADLASVEAAAKTFHANHDRLDLLINNAGIMAVPESKTVQGFEAQFGVNHLGHFALTAHLIDLLVETIGSRVVSVSSIAHKQGRMHFDDLMFKEKYDSWAVYQQSKLANLLFTFELARRLEAAGKDVMATVAHPGVSKTNLGDSMAMSPMKVLWRLLNPVMGIFLQPAAMGALPTLRAATDPNAESGDYFGPDGKNEMKGYPVKVAALPHAHNTEDQHRLWKESEKLTGVTFAI